MKKKFAVIVLLIIFLITFKSCRNEEILEKNENNTEQLKLIKSKSLWKENIIFISKVKRVFDKKVDAKKFRKKHGNAFWEYALSFEKDGEPYIFVPIVKDNKVEEVMLVLKKKKKIYFYFNKDDASKKAFFDILIKEKSAKAGSEVRKGGASNRLVCGWREIVWVWNTGLIETTYDYFCVEIDAAYIDTDLGGNTGFDLDDGDLPGGSSDNEITDPCSKIKSDLSSSKFKEKMSSLNNSTVLNYDHEMGFAASYPPAGTGITDTQYQPMDNKINTGKVTLPEGDRFFGYMHTHNNEDGVIKIFSNADISTFLTQCVRNAGNYGSMSDAHCMVITSNGSYMLRYTGDGSYNIGPNQLAKWEREYRKAFEELTVEEMSNQSNIEKIFTQFMKEIVNIGGLELYRVTDTTSEKLEYDGPDKPVKSTPCN